MTKPPVEQAAHDRREAAELRKSMMREDRATVATIIVFASIGLVALSCLIYLAVTR